MYAKAHPFSYKAVEAKGSINLSKDAHRGEQRARIQTVLMKNGQTRVITHYDHHKKGRTLGDMVYETYHV